MISTRDLDILINILREDKTLNEIAISYHKSFSKTNSFKIGCTLNILLEENLLPEYNRIPALYLLYEMYKTDSISSNPFLLLFLDELQNEHCNIQEKNFIIQLLLNPSKEVIKLMYFFSFFFFF